MKGFERMKMMKMNNGLCGLVSLTLALISMTTFAAPEVTDVVAKQRYPWNGLVDITCRVAGINGTTNGLKFAVAAVVPGSDAARKVWNFWTVQGGTNSTDRMVRTNGNYRLLWDAKADLGQVLYSNMVVRVNCVDVHGKVQLWEGGPYWAETNIGAEEPWEYGYYFWWGDTVGYKREGSTWVASDGSSSNFSFGSSPTFGKGIYTLECEGWITADSVLAPEHDAAQVQWGSGWRMPTDQELIDLCYNKCDWTWTTQNGVNGYLFRGRGDYASNSIFLPCAGYGGGTSLYDAGSHGLYWSSVPDSYRSYSYEYAWYLDFGSGGRTTYHSYRIRGLSVRPVQGFTE